MKKGLLIILGILFFLPSVGQAQTAAPAVAPQKHALATVASVAVAPVVHPKRTLKQIFGSAVFATENVVDVAHLVFAGADKAFDTLSLTGKIPVLDEIYAVVSIANKDTGKLDLWLERQERGLFGTSN